MDLNKLIGLDYSFYTLVCAVFFPLAAALAVFLCLRRAGTVRKILGYFIPMPIYVALCIFVLCEPQNSVIPLLTKTGLDVTLHLPEVLGAFAAVTLGILYLGIVSLACGGGVKKRAGRITCGIFTAIFTVLGGFLTAMQNVCFPEDTVTIPEIADRSPVVTLGEVFSHFGIGFDCDIGLDIAILAALLVYLIVYFLTFLGAGHTADEEEFSVSARHGRGNYDPAVEPCCALCEYARILKDAPGNVLCDRSGVVSEDHCCRRFVYDPLKRRPVRIPLPGMTDNNDHEDKK